MRKYLEKRLAKLTAKRDTLAARAKETQDINELRAINAQIEEINSDIADIRDQIAEIDAEPRGAADPVAAGAEPRGTLENGHNPISRFKAFR